MTTRIRRVLSHPGRVVAEDPVYAHLLELARQHAVVDGIGKYRARGVVCARDERLVDVVGGQMDLGMAGLYRQRQRLAEISMPADRYRGWDRQREHAHRGNRTGIEG